MKVFAIGDLHLPGSGDKAMDVFGEHWRGHAERIAGDWDARVQPNDWVLVPGDVSWAMRLHEAEADLAWLAQRPGTKVIIRGNHDYWWQSYRKVREALAPGCFALQNDCRVGADGRLAVAGARLWNVPGINLGGIVNEAPAEGERPAAKPRDRQDDEKIFQRELGRLRLSLQAMPHGAEVRVAMLHYPPTGTDLAETPATRLLEEHRVSVCVFAHLHNVRPGATFGGERNGIRYILASSDYLGFQLAEVAVVEDG